MRGRVAHESIFNLNDGAYRCPSSQQGYSPFTTWTRGLAWIVCGYAEELEFLATVPSDAFRGLGNDKTAVPRPLPRGGGGHRRFLHREHPDRRRALLGHGSARASRSSGDYLDRPAEPFNDHEPVDSSAAAITAQGLLRLGHAPRRRGRRASAAGATARPALTVARTLFAEPYLSTDPAHEGLLLHTAYHRPNGWDYVPAGRKVPCGESAMWGDYHLRELALLVLREAEDKPYPRFFLS